MATSALQQPSSTCVLCWPVIVKGNFIFFLNPRVGIAACGFPAPIPQQRCVETLHLHSGYAALAN